MHIVLLMYPNGLDVSCKHVYDIFCMNFLHRIYFYGFLDPETEKVIVLYGNLYDFIKLQNER